MKRTLSALFVSCIIAACNTPIKKVNYAIPQGLSTYRSLKKIS